ncbi:MAG TPA: excinuclease ABC subunit UvrC [bacterium]
MKKTVRTKITQAPSSPGVYIFKDAENKPIYIGKASSLKNRLASYVAKDDLKLSPLQNNAQDIDFIVTNSDVEALTLEESLIKLHKPKYNIRLKDDKKFPYLKITVKEAFPRVLFTRDLTENGSIIFGPYTNARALRQTRDALSRIFKIATCKKDLAKSLKRVCLEYSIGRCSGPCVGKINKDDYEKLVDKTIQFLKGNSDELSRILEKQMWDLAQNENFEAATALRNQLLAIRRITQRQQTVTSDMISRDVIGMSRAGTGCAACLMRIREGRLLSKETYHLSIHPADTDREIVSAFIRLIYTHITFLPEIILVPDDPDQKDIQLEWFRNKNRETRIQRARGKQELQLIKWTTRNAEIELAGWVSSRGRISPSLIDLQSALKLDTPPRLIEAFDISNLQEKYAVGSSVAFKDGRPFKQMYRHYRIKRVQGQNDFAMMQEIVSRRFRHRDAVLPDLLLIDGGKGQQSAVIEVIRILQLGIPVFALAKRTDELFYPDGSMLNIPSMSRSVILLKKLRDEAHRFAIGYHRKVRGKEFITSALDKISGIGKLRRVNLLKYFGSFEALKKASEEEIAKAPGIGLKTARVIYESLHS